MWTILLVVITTRNLPAGKLNTPAPIIPLIKLNTSLDIVAVPSTAIAPSPPPPLPPDMANATFNGKGVVAASPPARVLVRDDDDDDDDGRTFLLLLPHLLMEEDANDDNDNDGAIAKASALTNVAIARNDAATALLALMVAC